LGPELPKTRDFWVCPECRFNFDEYSNYQAHKDSHLLGHGKEALERNQTQFDMTVPFLHLVNGIDITNEDEE
jgi:hypothetical protein